MRILIAAAGSRGDVAPYTGLGAELRRAGHYVALAATDTFAPLARDAGLEFRSLPADTRGRGGDTGRRELMRAALPRSSPNWVRASPTRWTRARTCSCCRPLPPRSAGT
jgi:UDP:flavonoid glycosyltransferase YjiC (YdhE family)